jgi:hypothetical protein
MPGAIFSFDTDETEEMAEAIIKWAKAHKDDPETNYDRWMRNMHGSGKRRGAKADEEQVPPEDSAGQ